MKTLTELDARHTEYFCGAVSGSLLAFGEIVASPENVFAWIPTMVFNEIIQRMSVTPYNTVAYLTTLTKCNNNLLKVAKNNLPNMTEFLKSF